ncbi:MAG: DUF5666 domain-containing protein [Gammaproteobacteria bacterium]|nr:DUF5666 domain-containing protein [Gammaproteobacteria bacterium]
MKQFITMTTLAALLAGCGGSDGGSAGPGGTNVMSSGTISGYGSAVVNDVRYETANTRLISDDDGTVVLENPTDAELREAVELGEVVTVRGTRNDDGTGDATTIRIDDELVGEIESVSADDGTFVALGQTVSVTPDTIIDDSIIEAFRGTEVADDQRFGGLPETLDDLLSATMLVEVSGYPSRNGIEATRIDDVDGAGGPVEAEVKGFVKNLAGGQFNINTLTVMYDAGDLDDSFGGRDLREDDYVEVKGTPMGLLTLDANDIELEDDLLDDDFDEGEIEIEGVILDIRPDTAGSGGVIVINGHEIRVDDVSLFSEGLRVEIHGTLRSDGSVAVSRIHDEAEDTVRIEDRVEDPPGASSFTTRLGLVVIAPTDRTRLEDDTIDDDDNITLGDFLGNVMGNRIEGRGFPLGADVAWTRVEIEDRNDMDCRLRGPAANITGDASNFSFQIQGVTIDVSNVSDNNFEGVDGMSIGRVRFFGELDAGDIVQATSDSAGVGCVNGTLTAREVQQEPEDGAIFDDGTGGGDDGGAGGIGDNEIVGPVSNVLADSFMIGDVTITVDAATIIDDSIIEAARGVEVNDEAAFGDILDLTLPELLTNLLGVSVTVDRTSGVLALRIEDL